MAETIRRIPWKEYFKSQIFKIIGFLILALLVIGVMIVSEEIDLSPPFDFTDALEDPAYVIAVVLSSICFILVLVGFSKIILFDMASEFGLRDERTDQMVYNTRFFLFAALALSFCSAIYLLLDVFLYQDNPLLNIRPTYLQLLPVLIMEWLLISSDAEIPGLTDKIGTGREFYQTARNTYFGFFFIVIIAFSVLVFLSILTSLARKRAVSRFQKEEKVNEEEENKRLYKILAWIGIPILGLFLINLLATPIAPIIGILLIGMALWWLYQLIKTIFLILWRGMKITAFITSINALLIIPLIAVLYLLPVISWSIWDIASGDTRDPWFAFWDNAFSVLDIVQLDFVFITIIATFIVGFAEGFAIVAIFSAVSKGAEVARTGRVITHSPPKLAVIVKYLIMFSAWLGLSWNSLRSVLVMLTEEIHVELPDFFTNILEIPSLVYLIYDRVVIPLSNWFNIALPTLKYIPFLLLPLYFIIAGAFKFLSVTLITPRVKERLSFFFLLVSTAFVLIITNILGDIYKLGFPDAPLKSWNLEGILTSVVGIFDYVESVAFYLGFIFGIGWVIRKFVQSRRAPDVTIPSTSDQPEKTPVESLDQVLSSFDATSGENTKPADSNESEGNKNFDNV